MKIAILHNFMDNIGGAEHVDLMLARELKADIYTTCFDKDKIEKLGFKTDNIFSIGKIPINAPWRQEMAYWLFRNLNLGNKYDYYIIAGDWAMSAAVHNRPNLWYVYSPTRELWDLYKFTRTHSVRFILRPLFDIWVFVRRIINKFDSRHPEKVIATSSIVQKRIKKYLNRDSKIIYPPVDTAKYHYNKNGNFWLSVNRLISHKRIEMQLEAFAKMPEEKLIIVGSYEKSRHFQEHARRLMAIKPSNVEIISWVPEKELIELYADCRGFITTAKEEDFGLTPIEAMASGKPVIAPREGGYMETVLSGETGILIDNIEAYKLVAAIRTLSNKINDNPIGLRDKCQTQANKFDLSIFVQKVRQELES